MKKKTEKSIFLRLVDDANAMQWHAACTIELQIEIISDAINQTRLRSKKINDESK